MPVCKNDSTKKYKGDEPSPKGLGYCAHAEKLYTIKEGKDYNNWIVISNKNKIKKWIRLKIPKKLIDVINSKLPKVIKLKGNNDNYHLKMWKKINIKKELTDEIKDKIIKKNKKINIKKVSISKSGLDLVVIHDDYWDVYKDDNLLQYLKKIVNLNILPAEQGIQQNKKAFFEIVDWEKIYKKYK